MKDPEDLDNLVLLAAQGDRAPFEKLLLREYPRLYHRLRRMLPLDVLRHMSAEDVRQMAAFEAWQNVRTLKVKSYRGFRGWLDGILRNSVRYALRYHNTLKRGGGNPAGASHGDDVAAEANRLLEFLGRNTRSPRSALANKEFFELIQDALAAMESDERNAIRFRYLEQRPYSEVANLLKCSVDNARQRCLRALHALRLLLPHSSSDPKAS